MKSKWPNQYGRIIFAGAIKKKLGIKNFQNYLSDSYYVGRIDALEAILKYIKKYPEDSGEIISGEIHLELTEAMKKLKQSSKIPMDTSLNNVLKQTGVISGND